MNLALSAFLIIVVLIPGFIFRTGSKQAPWRMSSGMYSQAFFLEFIKIIILSYVLHVACYIIFNQFTSFSFPYVCLFTIIGNVKQTATTTSNNCYLIIGEKFIWVTAYFFALLAFSWLLGKGYFYSIRRLKLDIKYSFLRVYSDWYYTLSGDLIDIQSDEEDLAVFLSTVVKQGEIPYLYIGRVDDFWLDDKGELGTVALYPAYRRPLQDDRKPDQSHRNTLAGGDSRYYQIEGDRIFIKRSEMTTVNVEYVTISPIEFIGFESEIDLNDK